MKKIMLLLIWTSIALANPNQDKTMAKASEQFVLERLNYIIRLAEIDKAQANEKLIALIGQENKITQDLVVQTKQVSQKVHQNVHQNVLFPKITLIKVYK